MVKLNNIASGLALSLVFLSAPSTVLFAQDADQDWLARSTAPGVTMSTRFDSADDVYPYVLPDNPSYSNGYDNVSWDQSLKTSGAGSMKMELRPTDGTQHGNWRRYFREGDTNANHYDLQVGDVIYLQFRQYFPEYLVNHVWEHSGGSPTHFKQSIISRASGGSNTTYEVVLTSQNRGYPGMYHQDGFVTANGLDIPVNSACNGNDFRHQNVIDHGPNPLSGMSPDGDAWSPCEQDRARYGGLYSYNANLGFPRGPADPLTGAVIYPLDGWMTFLQRVELSGGYSAAGNKLDVWVAADGEDYTHIISDQNVRFGSKDDGDGFNGFWLLPYTSRGVPNPNRELTFTVYDEVIVSTNFIDAPGFPGNGSTDPMPSVTLSASPVNLSSGESTLLTWSSSDASSCTASSSPTTTFNGQRNTNNGAGETSDALTVDTTFTLSCANNSGSASDSVTVSVESTTQPQPTVDLSVSANNIDSGDSVTLTWMTTDTDICQASGDWSGRVEADGGSQTINNIINNSSFSITCANTAGTASDSENVTVNQAAPAPTLSFSATPAQVSQGGSTTLLWSSMNATSCQASGDWTGVKSTQGEESLTDLMATSSYSLICTGNGGSAAASVNVTVQDTSPNNDVDNDGLPDDWEIEHFGDLDETANGDADGDGFSNLAEQQAGTDPSDSSSVPSATSESGGGAASWFVLLFLCLLPNRRWRAFFTGKNKLPVSRYIGK